MDYGYEYFNGIDTDSVKPGASVTVKATLDNISELNSVNLVVDNENVISVTPTTFTPADTISFTVTGKAEGYSEIFFVFEKKDVADDEEKFVYFSRWIQVSNKWSWSYNINIYVKKTIIRKL